MTSMGLENIQYNLVVKMAVQEGQGRQVRGIVGADDQLVYLFFDYLDHAKGCA